MTDRSKHQKATIRFHMAFRTLQSSTYAAIWQRDSRKKQERQGNSMKCKNMMYEQQLAHLPKPKEEIFKIADEKLKAKRCALVVHNNDIKDDNTPAEEHIHMMMSFENARSINNVAKILGDKPQQIAKWNDKAENGFSYLVHATSGSQDKYQYDPADVIANFDYPAFLKQASIEVATSGKRQKASDLLDCFYAGAISREEVEQTFSGSQYGRFSRQLDVIEHKRMMEEAEAWRKQKITEKAVITTIWIFGDAGTGKTSFAREIAEKRDVDYYVTGSSRDIFQRYQSRYHTTIIDEFRPHSIPYEDLLRITDPHGLYNQVMLPCRYKDKPFASDLIIITSPYNPWDWYDELFHVSEIKDASNLKTELTDNFRQLNRRLSAIIYMDLDYMYATEYNSRVHTYEIIDGSRKPNPYSSKQRQSPAIDPLEVYNKLTD